MISSLCVAFQDISDELDLKIKKNLIGEIASFEQDWREKCIVSAVKDQGSHGSSGRSGIDSGRLGADSGRWLLGSGLPGCDSGRLGVQLFCCNFPRNVPGSNQL
ncbi:hypothetical protein PIB30_046525 [Stylosanthes scabra]|uniref:Uncharacterized protein n=1 Tax=Stylosanthes scabra TaxID=79078 RepID=A0ABU6RGL4_9FABA|nr:hypothetical protein [Stylosanthes scabra]